MTREAAKDLLFKYVEGERYRIHSLMVEAIMRKLAERLDPDNVELWGVVGLLHDLDEESCDWFNNPPVHGPTSVEILKSEGIEDEVLHNAILAHNPLCGYKAKTKLEFACLAADPMSGFIAAVAKVYPDKKVTSVKAKSVMKRFGEERFAKGANRSYMRAIEETGISLADFVPLAIGALVEIADEVGL